MVTRDDLVSPHYAGEYLISHPRASVDEIARVDRRVRVFSTMCGSGLAGCDVFQCLR